MTPILKRETWAAIMKYAAEVHHRNQVGLKKHDDRPREQNVAVCCAEWLDDPFGRRIFSCFLLAEGIF